MAGTFLVARLNMAIVALATIFAAAPASAEIHRFMKVSEGIYRGSEPENEADYRKLAELGIRTVINLRTSRDSADADEAAGRKLGCKVRHLPIPGYGVPSDHAVNTALEVLADPHERPVFVHCKLGRDRTGLVVALHRIFAEGWTVARAKTEMLKIGFNRALLGLDYYFWKRTHDRDEHERKPERGSLAADSF